MAAPALTAAHSATAEAAGYAHPDYARALAHIGQPRLLPGCGGWLLERPVPGASARDAIGAYPIFACRDWPRLAADLDGLSGLVSAGMVPDPLAGLSEAALRAAFDVVVAFKTHYVIDLAIPVDERLSAHHRRNVRSSRKVVSVERCQPADCRDEWTELYGQLVRRHAIRGLAAFPPASLAAQLEVPGAAIFRASHAGQTVGISVWYVWQGRASYHLAAYSPLGYALRASYAMFWHALEALRAEVRWVNLGGAPGSQPAGGPPAVGGLQRFKQGWATGTLPAYFCGRILDRERYAALAVRFPGGQGHFPAYRAPEDA